MESGLGLFVTFLIIAYGLLILPFIIAFILAILIKPVQAFLIFILLLPFHSLVLTILIAQLGMPIQIVKLIAAWKEALLLGTLVIVLLNAWVSNARIRLVWVDWLALIWLFQILFYFFFHNLIFDWSSSLTIRAYGARDWLLYILPYFVGRLMIASEKSAEQILKSLLFVGVTTSIIGIFERFFVPTSWHVALGVPIYMTNFLNFSYPDYLFGLPPNYWAEFGSDSIRRAVSTYFSAQGFALSFLVILPVVLYSYYTKLVRKAHLIIALCGLALLLTVTRMTIIACLMQGLLIMRVLHKKRQLALTLVMLFFAFFIVFAISDNLRTFIFNTLTLQDTSSRVRPERWATGIRTLVAYPIGQGLGITGSTGTRFGLDGAGDEAGYFKITGALGIPGLLLFLGWFLGIGIYSYRLLNRKKNIWQGIATVTFATTIGFLINNLTAPPDQLPFTIYIFACLAGLTVHYAVSQLPANREESSNPL